MNAYPRWDDPAFETVLEAEIVTMTRQVAILRAIRPARPAWFLWPRARIRTAHAPDIKSDSSRKTSDHQDEDRDRIGCRPFIFEPHVFSSCVGQHPFTDTVCEGLSRRGRGRGAQMVGRPSSSDDEQDPICTVSDLIVRLLPWTSPSELGPWILPEPSGGMRATQDRSRRRAMLRLDWLEQRRRLGTAR